MVFSTSTTNYSLVVGFSKFEGGFLKIEVVGNPHPSPSAHVWSKTHKNLKICSRCLWMALMPMRLPKKAMPEVLLWEFCLIPGPTFQCLEYVLLIYVYSGYHLLPVSSKSRQYIYFFFVKKIWDMLNWQWTLFCKSTCIHISWLQWENNKYNPKFLK